MKCVISESLQCYEENRAGQWTDRDVEMGWAGRRTDPGCVEALKKARGLLRNARPVRLAMENGAKTKP